MGMVKPDLGQRTLVTTMWTLGVDVGGTLVKLAVVGEDASTCYQSSSPTRTGEAGFLKDLRERVDHTLVKASQNGAQVSAIGIGVPGQVQGNRIVGGANNFPELAGVSLARELAAVNLPIKVENDAYMMGIAESRFGAAKDSADVVFLTVGTGIGAALKLNGRFYRGANHRASEIGHMVLSYGGARCSCGNRGCFEALASTSALINRYMRLSRAAVSAPGKPPAGPELVSLYHEGDPAAVEALQLHFDYLAAGIASLINIFDPQQVVVGGGITGCGDFYLAEVRRRVAAGVMSGSKNYASIDPAGLGNWAGCIGAACLFSDSPVAAEHLEDLAQA